MEKRRVLDKSGKALLEEMGFEMGIKGKQEQGGCVPQRQLHKEHRLPKRKQKD